MVYGTGTQDGTFPWASAYPHLASQAGSCSTLSSANNSFDSNHAVGAGAVVYSTNISTLALSCTADDAARNSSLTCPAPLWSNNTVGGSSSAVGYGAGVASEPASIVLDVAPMHSYVSNGTVKLPLRVYVMDQTDLNVTAGMNRVSCKCTSSNPAYMCCSACCIAIVYICVSGCIAVLDSEQTPEQDLQRKLRCISQHFLSLALSCLCVHLLQELRMCY